MPQPQDDFVALTSMVGVSTGSISADLQDIPNGPIRFTVILFRLVFIPMICLIG
jgi:hypothetical protein